MNSIYKKVASNASFLIFGQIISRVFSFGYFLLLQRFLSVEDFGQYNLVLSFLVIGDSVADFGLSKLIIRDVARDHKCINKYLSILVPLKLLMGLIAYITILSFTYISGFDATILLYTAISALGLIFSGLAIAYDSAIQGLQKMFISSLCFVILSFFQLILGFLAIYFMSGVIPVLIALIVANAIHMSILLFGLHREGYHHEWKWSSSEAWSYFKQAAPYGGIAIMATFALRAETVVLGWFNNGDDLGYYSAAVKFPEAALFFPMMFGVALTPAMAKLHLDTSGNELRKIYHWSLRMALLVVIPISITVVLFSDLVFQIFFPVNYQESVYILQVMFLIFPLMAVMAINSSMLFSSDKQKQIFMVFTSITLTQYLLNIFFVSQQGLHGSLLALALTQFLSVILTSWIINKWFLHKGISYIKTCLPPFVGSLGIFTIIYFYDFKLEHWMIIPILFLYLIIAGSLHFLFPINEKEHASENDLEKGAALV